MNQLEERLKRIISKRLNVNVEEIAPEAKFVEDLGADSLSKFELVMTIEEEFEVDIPDKEAERIMTLSDVLAFLSLHAGKGHAVV